MEWFLYTFIKNRKDPLDPLIPSNVIFILSNISSIFISINTSLFLSREQRWLMWYLESWNLKRIEKENRWWLKWWWCNYKKLMINEMRKKSDIYRLWMNSCWTSFNSLFFLVHNPVVNWAQPLISMDGS